MSNKKNKVLKLSVALATYNEENNIVDCIDSTKSFADEVVVVDGTSTDRTAELAKALGAKVITTENRLMFHINKNLAIENSTGDWILLLDADERVEDDLGKEIKRLIETNPSENGFWVNRRNWFLGGFLTKGGAYPDPVIRLFRRGTGRLPEISVHEQVKINGQVGYLKNDLIHMADPDFTRYLLRANRYTSHSAKKHRLKNTRKDLLGVVYYLIIKPIVTFSDIYFRHAGFKDGFRGFIWALFSGAHHFYAYAKYLTDSEEKE